MRAVIMAILMLFVGVGIKPTSADTILPVLETYPLPGADQKEMICLAQNIYFEARSDNLAGKYAVADVVLNRVKDRRYPESVCGVVQQGPVRESWKTKKDKTLLNEERIYHPVKNMCQFSWYCDGKKDETKNKDRWEEAKEIAYNIMFVGKHRGITEGATHYHATYVSPDWSHKLQRVGRIGLHLFYRWP